MTVDSQPMALAAVWAASASIEQLEACEQEMTAIFFPSSAGGELVGPSHLSGISSALVTNACAAATAELADSSPPEADGDSDEEEDVDVDEDDPPPQPATTRLASAAMQRSSKPDRV